MKYYKGPYGTVFSNEGKKWSYWKDFWREINCGDACHKVIQQYNLKEIDEETALEITQDKPKK